VAATLAAGWQARGCQVTLVTNSSAAADFYELPRGVARVGLGLVGRPKVPLGGVAMTVRRVLALRRVVRRVKPRAAVGFMPTANILCWLACVTTRTRVVGSEHTHPPALVLSRGWRRLRQTAYRRIDAVVVPTRGSADYLGAELRIGHVYVVPNPVPYPLPAAAPRLSPGAFRQPNGQGRLLLAAGRLSREKGFDLLLHAFSRVAGRHPDWRLVILGEGGERAALTALVSDLGLDDRVDLPGACGNIGDWYAQADLYVLSSRVEGFGNTLAEALSYGVPSIAADCQTGPRDILRHGVDGLLVPPEDADALARSLDRLMAAPHLRRTFAASAVEARARFDPDRILGQWTEICLPEET
jgi:glycosyltransferase involved in cell wall biosynthesis